MPTAGSGSSVEPWDTGRPTRQDQHDADVDGSTGRDFAVERRYRLQCKQAVARGVDLLPGVFPIPGAGAAVAHAPCLGEVVARTNQGPVRDAEIGREFGIIRAVFRRGLRRPKDGRFDRGRERRERRLAGKRGVGDRRVDGGSSGGVRGGRKTTRREQ
ncbi:MAG: hypothetical protein P8Z41_15680 [Anaerolineales bacterium]